MLDDCRTFKLLNSQIQCRLNIPKPIWMFRIRIHTPKIRQLTYKISWSPSRHIAMATMITLIR